MKILKSLNKKNLFLIFIVFFVSTSHAEDQPIDIWNIDKKNQENKSSGLQSSEENTEINSTTEFEIFNMQKQKDDILVTSDDNLNSKEIKIYGLYDPQNYDLDIDMWLNSDGDQIKNIFFKLDKIKLSKDSTEIIKIALLTNAQNPKKNISEKEFLNFKSNWLIKNSDLDLIEEYLIKNQMFNLQPNLTKYLVNQYLSETNIEKACEILSKNLEPFNNEYLSKFNIYCLIYSGKKEEAQLIFDLKKELGFSDKYFEKKINYLFGYTSKIDNSVSEKSIFDFYLAHQTDSNFVFEPKNSTKKIIWKYLSASGLLKSFKLIEISELNKISTLEKATNDKNYPEKDLLEIYKRFQFNINQLLTANF